MFAWRVTRNYVVLIDWLIEWFDQENILYGVEDVSTVSDQDVEAAARQETITLRNLEFSEILKLFNV